MRRSITALSFLVSLLLWARATAAGELLVFAAASLTDALEEAAQDYAKATGNKVLFNFGASSLLARQIQEGARADIFVSADEEKMDVLQSRGLLREETRRSLLSNALVIVVEREKGVALRTPADLKLARRVAIAEPATVPAGIYAKRHLEELGLWGELNILPTGNVRGALLAVESGNAEAGIVYKTDAAMGQKVRVAYEFPPHAQIKISYCTAVLKESPNPEAGQAFLRHLRSEAGGKVFKKHGFVVLNGD